MLNFLQIYNVFVKFLHFYTKVTQCPHQEWNETKRKYYSKKYNKTLLINTGKRKHKPSNTYKKKQNKRRKIKEKKARRINQTRSGAEYTQTQSRT